MSYSHNLNLRQWYSGTQGFKERIPVLGELIVIDRFLEADDEGGDRLRPRQIFDKQIEPIWIADHHRGLPRIGGGGDATAAQKVGGGRRVGGGRELPEECHSGKRGGRGLVSSPATAQVKKPGRVGVTGWRRETSSLRGAGSHDASPLAAPQMIFYSPPSPPFFRRICRSGKTTVPGCPLRWPCSFEQKQEAGPAVLPEC